MSRSKPKRSKQHRIDETEKMIGRPEEQEDAADLPERDALSLIDPGTLLGGLSPIGSSPTQPTSGNLPTDGTTTPAAPQAPNVPSLPQLPNLPQHNPGGTYQPDTSASDTTKA